MSVIDCIDVFRDRFVAQAHLPRRGAGIGGFFTSHWWRAAQPAAAGWVIESRLERTTLPIAVNGARKVWHAGRDQVCRSRCRPGLVSCSAFWRRLGLALVSG